MNIGPWWVYDLIIICIILFNIIINSTKGIQIAIYNLISGIICLVLSIFIAKLIAEGLTNFVSNKLENKIHLSTFESFVDSMIQTALSGIGGNNEDLPTFTDSGILDSIISFFVNGFLYAILVLVVFLFLSGISLILYVVAFKNKKFIKNINPYVNVTIGIFLGIFVGIIAAYPLYVFASFPLFNNGTIKTLETSASISVQNKIPKNINDLNLNEYNFYENNGEYIEYQNQIDNFDINYIKNENNLSPVGDMNFIDKLISGTNSFNQNALTSKVFNLLKISKNQLYFGLNKYILEPLQYLIENKNDDGSFDINVLTDKLLSYENLITRGYAETNPIYLPINTWISILPSKGRIFVRTFLEGILALSANSTGYANYNNGKPTSAGYVSNLISELDEFKNETNWNKNVNSKWLNEAGVKKFYEWAKNKAKSENKSESDYNEFVKVANIVEAETQSKRYIATILRDPTLTYNFSKNMYNLSNEYALDGTLPFLPNIFSSLFLMNGWETVESGLMLAHVFGMATSDGGFENMVLKDYWDFM